MSLLDIVYHFMRHHQLARKGDLVIIAVSGGNDSVVLLDVLVRLRPRLGIRLHVAHYDHRLRPGSFQDARFVKALAVSYGLPFSQAHRSGPIKKLSEDKARQLRMDFLTTVAKKYHAASIATAHHANDVAETVLMRLIRGSGLAGLRGVLPSHHWNDVRVIRPLLTLSRCSLEAYRQDKGLEFREDITNVSMDFTRNHIRAELLPLLVKKFNPQILEVLRSFAEVVSADYDFLQQYAKDLLKDVAVFGPRRVTLSRKAFLSHHLSMQRMLVRQSLEILCKDLNVFMFSHIDHIVQCVVLGKPRVFMLPRRVHVRLSKEKLVIYI